MVMYRMATNVLILITYKICSTKKITSTPSSTNLTNIVDMDEIKIIERNIWNFFLNLTKMVDIRTPFPFTMKVEEDGHK